MFAFRRAQNFRRLSSSNNEELSMEMIDRDESQSSKENDPFIQDIEETDVLKKANGTSNDESTQNFPSVLKRENKPPLLRFAASVKKVRENTGQVVENTEVDDELLSPSQRTLKKPKTPTTPMKDAATNVKNVKSAVTFMQKASLRSSLKKKLRKIAEERLTIRQIFRRYVDQSTLHGFRYIVSDSYYVRRFLWACLMILGAVYFIIKLKQGIIEYFSYPFSTLSTMEYVKESLPLPAITFCSVNQFKLSRLEESPLMYRLYKENRLPLPRNWSDPGFDISGEELHEQLKNVSLNIDDIFKHCDWIKRDTAHPLVPPRVCHSGNFTSHFSKSGQICFTLNSGKDNHTKLEVNHFGINDGYEAMFDFNNQDVIPFEDYTGIHVIIHDPNELPTDKVGFLISPGFKVYVNLKRVEVNNLEPPYSTKCGEKQLKYYETYSQSACLMEKLTDFVGEKCGCRELYMPDNNLPYCSLRETFSCAYPMKESFNQYEARLECPIDCQVVEYQTTITDSRFLHNPPTGLEPAIIKQHLAVKKQNKSHILDLHNSMNHRELEHYVEDNLVEVIFFFGEMSKTIHTQEASFDFYQFLGDMGGEIGLMLGASLLTFFEFIDLFAFLGYHQLLRLQKRWTNDDEENKEEDEVQGEDFEEEVD